jgi:hypothetical protein
VKHVGTHLVMVVVKKISLDKIEKCGIIYLSAKR